MTFLRFGEQKHNISAKTAFDTRGDVISQRHAAHEFPQSHRTRCDGDRASSPRNVAKSRENNARASAPMSRRVSPWRCPRDSRYPNDSSRMPPRVTRGPSATTTTTTSSGCGALSDRNHAQPIDCQGCPATTTTSSVAGGLSDRNHAQPIDCQGCPAHRREECRGSRGRSCPPPRVLSGNTAYPTQCQMT